MAEVIEKVTVVVRVQTTKRDDETELVLRANETVEEFQRRVTMEIDVLMERV